MASCTKPADGKCEPCESLDKSSLLPNDALDVELASSFPLWKRGRVGNVVPTTTEDGGEKSICIHRTFTAKNFQASLDALNSVGAICESLGHHADLHLTSYRNVTIVIYTHSVGGVTRNDLELAKALDDEVKVTYSPKWLKENEAALPTAA